MSDDDKAKRYAELQAEASTIRCEMQAKFFAECKADPKPTPYLELCEQMKEHEAQTLLWDASRAWDLRQRKRLENLEKWGVR